MRLFNLVAVLGLVLLVGASANAEQSLPKLIGKGDPLLKELVSTRVSVGRRTNKPDSKLNERLLAGARAEWIPTLRAILERPPIDGYPSGASERERDAVLDRMNDESFWRQNAAALLARLQDAQSIDKIFAEPDGAHWLMPFGRVAVERAGRLLFDEQDPLRRRIGTRGQAATEHQVLRHVGGLFAHSGSPVVRDALLNYGARKGERCQVASILTQLPPSPASATFVKGAIAEGIAKSDLCDPSLVAWADMALVRWMQQEYLTHNVTGTGMVVVDRAIALLGDEASVQGVMADVVTNGTSTEQEEFAIYLAFAQQCRADIGCYVEALKGFKGPKPGSSKFEWFRMGKARAMVAQAHDTARAETLLGNKELYMAAMFSPFSQTLEALVGPTFAQNAEKLPYLGDDLRLQREMRAFINPWQAPAAPTSDVVVVPSSNSK